MKRMIEVVTEKKKEGEKMYRSEVNGKGERRREARSEREGKVVY